MDKSESMLLGELVHSIVFPLHSPPIGQSEYVLIPEGIDRRTKEGKIAYAEFDADPRIKITKKLFDKAQEIADNVLSITLIRRLKDHMDSCNEVSCLFDIEGVPAKCRWDFINPHIGLILDLKTTIGEVDEESFAKTIAKFSYDQQAAFYADAAERAYGKKFKVAFVAVSTTAPYDACLYVADDQMLEVGRQLYRENLTHYKRLSSLKITDIKQILDKREFNKISLPAWATDLSRR
jgi:hypothetical protein